MLWIFLTAKIFFKYVIHIFHSHHEQMFEMSFWQNDYIFLKFIML